MRMQRFIGCAAAGCVALGIAFPVFAADGQMKAALKAGAPTLDIACVQTAVDKREDALDSAIGTFNGSILSAYQGRKTALHDAWSKTEAKERRTAVKAAWEAFKKAKKSAAQDWKKSQKSAWQTFSKDGKACKGGGDAVTVEAAGQASDE